MSGRNELDLVIFDSDGVLIDSQVIQCRTLVHGSPPRWLR
jgi:hypothetical protein